MNQELYQRYLNISNEDKKYFFKNLSEEERQNLFESLNKKERRFLFSRLRTEELTEFMNLYPEEIQKEMFQYYNSIQLNNHYKKLPEEKKEEFKKSITELRERLEKEREQSHTNIEKLSDVLDQQEINTINSKNNILDAKQTIRESNKDLIKIKFNIKKVELQRKIALARAERIGKPSSLDKIGIISKIKKNILKRRLEKYNQIDDKLNVLNEEKDSIIETKMGARESISNERENIKFYHEEEKNTRIQMAKEIRNIRDTEVIIKQVTNADKMMLATKIKRCKAKDKVFSRKKEKEEKKKSTKEAVTESTKVIEKNGKNGVKYYPADGAQIVTPQPNALLDTVIAELTPKQKEIFATPLTLFGNYITQQQQIIQQQQQMIAQQQQMIQQNVPVRTRSAGKIDFFLIMGLLIGIIGISITIAILIYR